MNKLDGQLNVLIHQGFRDSYIRGKYIQVACDSCESLVINSIATHEHGCSNARHECYGCSELIKTNQRYCADCA